MKFVSGRTQTTVLFWAILINSLLASAYKVTSVSAVSSLNNLLSVAVLTFFLMNISVQKVLKRHLIFGLTATVSLCCTVIFNIDSTSAPDTIKLFAIYIAFYFGHYCVVSFRLRRFELLVIAAIPLLFGVLLQNRVDTPNVSVSYFPNANTAALFFTALVFASIHELGRFTLFLQFLHVLFLQKVGVIAATVVATVIWSSRFSFFRLLIVCLFLVVLAVLLMPTGVLERPVAVFAMILSDFQNLGLEGIVRLGYDEISWRQASTDLSGYFRIKHWVEIWTTYANSGFAGILFGYGPGQTMHLTSHNLIPHNDYLRILAEFGAINLLLFVWFNGRVLSELAKRNARGATVFSILLIYYFSENLLDNFASMMLFYVFAGAYTGREKTAEQIS